jgi:hypothetical protein
VFRAALVSVSGRPHVVLELEQGRSMPPTSELRELADRYDATRGIRDFHAHPGFPVDIRHNAKIKREELARWAAAR